MKSLLSLVPVALLLLAGTALGQLDRIFGRKRLLYGNKMYTNGTYAYLRGVNVIAKILPSQAPWLEPMYRFLEASKYIKHHYSLLPLESFHMTVHPLFTEYEIPDRFKFGRRDWNGTLEPLTENVLGFIMHYLDAHPLVLHPEFDDIHPSTGILTVSLKLPREEVEAVSALWDVLRERYPYRDYSFGLFRDVFSLSPANGTYGFHFTIGYFYNHADINSNVENLIKELEELKTYLTEKYTEPITLDKARLHWFESMADFRPVLWADSNKKDSLSLFGRTISTQPSADSLYDKNFAFHYATVLLFVAVVLYVLLLKRGRKAKPKHKIYSLNHQ